VERARRRRGLSSPQPGRRERKKLAARSAILDASARLFVKKGFEGTRIETIAQDADVGVGTVYNHFATKADILVAILFGDVADVVAGTRAIVERGGPDAAAVVGAAVGVLLGVMERRPRNLWRDLIGHALLDGGALGLAYRSAETVLLGVVRTGFERLRANGRIDAKLPAEESTEIAFALAKTGIYRYAFNDVSAADVVKDLERQIRTVAPAPESATVARIPAET
jgi:AcrR family transcriptional regulator